MALPNVMPQAESPEGPGGADAQLEALLAEEGILEEVTEVRENIEALPDADVFALDAGMDHPIVQKFQPAYLARGGSQIVYDIAGFPELVAKADMETLILNMNKNKKEGLPLNGLNNKKESLQTLRSERARFQRMASCFGKDHVLGQAKILRRIPITPRILAKLYNGNPPGVAHEAWTAVMLQRRAEELQDSERLNLIAGYAEVHTGGATSDEYASVTSALLEKDGACDTAAFLRVQDNEKLNDLVANAEENPDLKQTLRQLIQDVIRYTHDTGEILDLAGDDNVTVFQKDGKWTYRLIDALYPKETDTIERTRAIIARLAEGHIPNRDEQGCLLNIVNYARTINGLASYSGLQDRIELIPESLKGVAIDFKKGMEQILREANERE